MADEKSLCAFEGLDRKGESISLPVGKHLSNKERLRKYIKAVCVSHKYTSENMRGINVAKTLTVTNGTAT